LYGGSTLDLFIEGCEQQQSDIRKDGDTATNDSTLQQLKLLTRDKIGDLRLHSRSFIGASNDTDASTEKEEDDTNIEKLSIQDDSDNLLDKKVSHQVEDTAKSTDVKNEEDIDTKTEPTTTQKQDEEQQQATINPMEHGFCFDLTPSLLFASGDAVQGLVTSGVADYLEFKSLKGLYLLMEEESKSSSSKRSRRGRTVNSRNKQKDNEGASSSDGTTDVKKLTSYLVPCSKGDVFRSKLLSPIDKRRLMKFLQLISDYGMATQSVDGQSSNINDTSADIEEATNDAVEEKDDTKEDEPNNTAAAGEDAIQSINERHLHRGRALSRPQNKATASSSEMDALMQCIRDNVSFSDFLANTAKLPERLSTVVIHALALAPFGNVDDEKYSTKDGVDDLVRHLTALGRFGDTAFLLPMYGSGELSQAFCRSGAVYGSTYMLRRSPLAISYDESQAVKGVVLSGEDHIGASDDVDTDDVTDREIPCKHVIVPSTMISPSNAHETSPKLGRTYRRISIIQGKLMLDRNDTASEPTDTEQRHAVIIPSGTSGTKSAIHGVVVDDSAFVAPPRKDCTILHLSTSSQEGDDTSDEHFVDALKTAVEHLITSQSSKALSVVKECHHISFSYSTGSTSLQDNLSQTSGLHVCNRDQLSLTCDSAFREAERIFQTICPDSDFLALAKKVEDAIVYREEHDSDDEKKVLESACTMVQGGSAAEADELPISDEDVNTEETAVKENEHEESGSKEK